jgi:hypothetical protein
MTRLTNKQLQKYLDGKCDIDCNEIDEMAQELIPSRELLDEVCGIIDAILKNDGGSQYVHIWAENIKTKFDALKAGE